MNPRALVINELKRGPISIAELASRFNVSASHLRSFCRKLHDFGIIERGYIPGNKPKQRLGWRMKGESHE